MDANGYYSKEEIINIFKQVPLARAINVLLVNGYKFSAPGFLPANSCGDVVERGIDTSHYDNDPDSKEYTDYVESSYTIILFTITKGDTSFKMEVAMADKGLVKVEWYSLHV